MIGLVIGHVPCALDHQRRIREARSDRMSRAVARSGRRGKGDDPQDLGPELRRAGEDVWQALRF